MTTYAHGGWSFGVSLEDLLDRAIVHAQVGSSSPYKHLGDDDTSRQTRVAEIVNEIVEAVTQANPGLGVSTTDDEVSVVSGTREYSIPSSLHGIEIDRIQYKDGQDSSIDTKILEHFTRSRALNQLPIGWRNGENTAKYPMAWSLNEDRSKIVLYPEPSTSSTLEVYYRPAPTAVTQANVASPSGVTLSEIPVIFARVYALGIAWRIAEYVDTARSEVLRQRYREELMVMQRELVTLPAGMTPRGSGRDYPNRAVAQDTLHNFEASGYSRW